MSDAATSADDADHGRRLALAEEDRERLRRQNRRLFAELAEVRDELAELRTEVAVSNAELKTIRQILERQGRASEQCMGFLERLWGKTIDTGAHRWVVGLLALGVIALIVIAGSGVTIERTAGGDWSFGASGRPPVAEVFDGDGASELGETGGGGVDAGVGFEP